MTIRNKGQSKKTEGRTAPKSRGMGRFGRLYPGGGGGGRLQCEMPGCGCWGSKNAPIMKDALCHKTYLY